MKPVVDCLLILRAKSLTNSLGDNTSLSNSNASSPRGYGPSSFHSSPLFGVDSRKLTSESRFQRVMSSSSPMAGPVNFIKLTPFFLYVLVVHKEKTYLGCMQFEFPKQCYLESSNLYYKN